MAKKKFYAVHKGVRPGVYRTWAEAEPLVKGFAGARFKGFASQEAADYFFRTGRESAAETTTTRGPPPQQTRARPQQQQQQRPQQQHRRQENWAYVLYTDGGCHGNQNVASNRTQPSGWGVVVQENNATVAELYGPVDVDEGSPYFLGAEVCSNNTAELTGMGEALIWLRDHATRPGPVALYYDSKYAANIAQRIHTAHKNVALATRVQGLLDAVNRSRPVHFLKVKGHSGDPGNDRADELSKLGWDGRRSGRSSPAVPHNDLLRTSLGPDAQKRKRTIDDVPPDPKRRALPSNAVDVIDLTGDD